MKGKPIIDEDGPIVPTVYIFETQDHLILMFMFLDATDEGVIKALKEAYMGTECLELAMERYLYSDLEKQEEWKRRMLPIVEEEFEAVVNQFRVK